MRGTLAALVTGLTLCRCGGRAAAGVRRRLLGRLLLREGPCCDGLRCRCIHGRQRTHPGNLLVRRTSVVADVQDELGTGSLVVGNVVPLAAQRGAARHWLPTGRRRELQLVQRVDSDDLLAAAMRVCGVGRSTRHDQYVVCLSKLLAPVRSHQGSTTNTWLPSPPSRLTDPHAFACRTDQRFARKAERCST